MSKIRRFNRNIVHYKGPGSPDFRFSYLMDELEKRFPDPEPYSAKLPENRHLALIDAEREKMRNALSSAIVALDDWTRTYAPEFCDEDSVKNTKNRLMESGTLCYIATVIQQCKDALK